MYNVSKVTQKDQTGAVALIAEYIYRPDGLRHSKTITKNGVTLTHTHIWDGQNIVAEIGATGTIVARYLRGLSLIAREQDGACQYYFHNAHGDVVQRIDARGNLLKNYDYDAFGNEQNPVEEDSNPFRYCGEYWDKETETLYLRARNYDPKNGRFTREDPARDGTNWHNYCGGNPIALIDRNGLKAEKLENMVMAVGGTVTWNDKTQTATVSIWGNEKTYTVGEDGVSVANGEIYVLGEQFATDFNGSYAEITGKGLSGYQLSVNVDIYERSSRDWKLYNTNTKYYTKVSSVTFDDTIEGERAAGQMNLDMQDAASYSENMLIMVITPITTESGVALGKALPTLVPAKDILNVSFMKAPTVHAGDTYVSQVRGYYSSSGGSRSSGFFILGKDGEKRYKDEKEKKSKK